MRNPQIFSRTVTLTAADLYTLNTIPVQGIPALGNNVLATSPIVTAVFKPNGFVGNLPDVPLNFKYNNDFSICSTVLGNAYRVVMAGVDTYDSAQLAFDQINNKPLMLSSGIPLVISGSLVTTTIQLGGANFLPGNTFSIPQNAAAIVDAVANSYQITALDQGAKSFTVTGDLSAGPPSFIAVYGSTGNDGGYTVNSAIFGAGSTVIVVQEAIPSAVANGFAGDGGIAVGEVTAYTITDRGNNCIVENNLSCTATTGVGVDLLLDILDINPRVNPITIDVLLSYFPMSV